MFENLKSKIKIGNVTINNRFVMPTLKLNLCTKDGYITQRDLGFFIARAKGGFGLIFTDEISLDNVFKVDPYGPNYSSQHKLQDIQVLTKSVHKYKSKIFASFCQPGMESCQTVTDKKFPVPSIEFRYHSIRQNVLTDFEIKKVIRDFVKATHFSKEAGFDGLCLNASKDYLLGAFLSPFYNHRDDQYGGNFENRFRIVQEIYHEIRINLGADFPIGIKLSICDTAVPGRTFEETKKIAIECGKLGFDFVMIIPPFTPDKRISGSYYESMPKENTFEDCKEIRRSLKIPLMLTANVSDPRIGEQCLKDKVCDLVAFGKSGLADSDFPNKVINNHLLDIAPCIHCISGCSESLLLTGSSKCVVNPFLGNEEFIKIEKAKNPLRIGIIGLGLAATSMALYLAKAGHSVEIYHSEDKIGNPYGTYGQNKNEYPVFLDWMLRQYKKYKVTLHLNSSPTPKEILAMNFDRIIIGYGANPYKPTIKGIDNKDVYPVEDLFLGKVTAGENNVILGSGYQACEAATFLSDRYKQVTILTKNDYLLSDLDGLPNPEFTARLFQSGVSFYKIYQDPTITRHSVIFNIKDRRLMVLYDRVFYATGYDNMVPVYNQLLTLGYPKDNIFIIEKKGNVGLSAVEGIRVAKLIQ